jgi:alginate O-acetyltransferase complex protein AlgI
MLSWERLTASRGWFKGVPRPLKIAFTFTIVLFTWVFFRAENFDVAWRYLSAMFGSTSLAATAPLLEARMLSDFNVIQILIASFVAFIMPNTQTILRTFVPWKGVVGLLLLMLSVAIMFARGHSPFLYFQF